MSLHVCSVFNPFQKRHTIDVKISNKQLPSAIPIFVNSKFTISHPRLGKVCILAR